MMEILRDWLGVIVFFGGIVAAFASLKMRVRENSQSILELQQRDERIVQTLHDLSVTLEKLNTTIKIKLK